MTKDKDCCYSEMSPIGKARWEDSEQIEDKAEYENSYEMNRSGSNGLNQSGMK